MQSAEEGNQAWEISLEDREGFLQQCNHSKGREMQFYPSRTQTIPICGSSLVSNQNLMHQPTRWCFCHHQLVRGANSPCLSCPRASPHPPASHTPQMMSQPSLSHWMPGKSRTALRGTAWIPWVLPSWDTTSEPLEMLQAHFHSPHVTGVSEGSCTPGRAVPVCGLCLHCEPAQERVTFQRTLPHHHLLF